MNDLKLIFSELHDVCDKWYSIGLELDLSVDYLEDLDIKHSGDKTTCLRKVLVEWLKSNEATWLMLIEVLNSSIVQEQSLAEFLRKKYGASGKGHNFTCLLPTKQGVNPFN